MKAATPKIVFVLTAIAVVSAALLSYTANLTYPIIAKNRRNELRRAILQVVPGAHSFEPLREGREIYLATGENGNLIGYAFVGKGGGYQGIIKIMIGISPDWKHLLGIRVLESIETPGLGARIASAEFQAQFRGLQVTPKIEYVRNKRPEKPNQIEAITGATISSRAVVRILNRTIRQVQLLLKQTETGS